MALPPQAVLVATTTAGVTLVLLSVIVGLGRNALMPNCVSEGPAARASNGLMPLVPAPPSTVPMVIFSPATSGARMERLMSRPGFVATPSSAALTSVTGPHSSG